MEAMPAAGPGRYLAVGDVHGRSDLLEAMLNHWLPRLDARRQVVFLGDYIDRGPDSAGVLERLMDLGRKRPDTVFLLGNHERLCLDAIDRGQEFQWLVNGGMATMESYGLRPEQIKELPAGDLAFLRSLRLYYDTPDYLFVHAGLRPGVPLEQQQPKDLVWIRDDFFQSETPYHKTVVFGHTPFSQPLERDDIIGIDTGAVFGGGLTCLALPEREFTHF